MTALSAHNKVLSMIYLVAYFGTRSKYRTQDQRTYSEADEKRRQTTTNDDMGRQGAKRKLRSNKSQKGAPFAH